MGKKLQNEATFVVDASHSHNKFAFQRMYISNAKMADIINGGLLHIIFREEALLYESYRD